VATLLARQLEPLAERRLVQVVAVSPTDDGAAARALVEEVSAELAAWDVPVPPIAPAPRKGADDASSGSGVRFLVRTPLAPFREWRRIADESDGLVLVLEAGRIDRAGLQEIRSVVVAAGIRVLAVVLRPRSRNRQRAVGVRPQGSVPAVPPAGGKATKANGAVLVKR
jgi:hypothetical protein